MLSIVVGSTLGLQSTARRNATATTIICSSPIQTCIDNALSGDTIFIPAGTYTESLTLGKPVSLTGAGSDAVFIKAVEGQRVLTVTGSAISNTVVISGLAIAGGRAITAGQGGGILIVNAARPLLHTLIISDNQAVYGGGIYAASGSPLSMTNVILISNTAASGGGVYVNDVAEVLHSRFEKNVADYSVGGGLYGNTLIATDTQFICNEGSNGGGAYIITGRITSGRFECNYAGSTGGGLYTQSDLYISSTAFLSNTSYGNGGGVMAWGPVSLDDVRFENNRCTQDILCMGGGLVAPLVTVTDTHFVSNAANYGGGLWANFAQITGSRFERNQAANEGGGLNGGTGLVHETEFVDNIADYGGGIHWSGTGARIVNALFARNRAGTTGAGVTLQLGSGSVILHSSFSDVGLNPKQAIYVAGGEVGITNTIVTSHAIGIAHAGGSVYADYNLFYGNTLNKTGVISGGAHDRNGDPRFVDPAIDDYHLRFGSPAMNAGVDAGVVIDIDGDSRPQWSGFDIGYDEVLSFPPRMFLPLVLKGY
jgi:hypothetical protein